MPSLIGKTYLEILDFLKDRSLPNPLNNGGDIPGTNDNKNRAVQQDPLPDTPITHDTPITINYGS